MCLLFAATYPERTLGLLLWGCFARYDWRRSFIGRYWGGETVDDALDRLEREWGDGGDLAAMAPSLAGDDAARRAWGRAQRLSATPTAARALLRMMLDVDVRPLLPAIRVPVVILHRAGEVAVDVSHSRYMAEHIPGARYVELPGSDHLPWIGDTEPIVAEIQELVTGTRPEPEPDRVVATVMFVDAPHAVEVAAVRSGSPRSSQPVARFRGDMLAARGDSLGASFDGPARAIRCAEAIVAESDRSGARCRAGIHTGECELHDGGAPRSRRGHGRRDPRPRRSGRGAGLADGGGPGGGRGDRFRRSRQSRAGDRRRFMAASGHLRRDARRRSPRRTSPRCCSGARGTTGRLRSAGRWSACATPRDSDTWPVSCAIPTASSTCSTCWPVTHDAADDTAREDGLVAATADAGVVLDEPAKHAYRERIAELEAEIEQARRWNDLERTARAEGELDALTRELAGALGLGGRDRRAASDSERARASVSKAVRSAVRRLEDAAPRAGPPPLARRAHRHVLHVRPRPEGARRLGRLRSPPGTRISRPPDMTTSAQPEGGIADTRCRPATRCSSSTSRTPRRSSGSSSGWSSAPRIRRSWPTARRTWS